jgi:hypothetical protein
VRNAIILCSLLLSAVLGAAAILSHRWALQSVIFYIGCVWTLAHMVASGVYRRSYWQAHNVTMSQIYTDAKQGRQTLPRPGAMERVTSVGSAILMLLFFSLYFI